MAATESKAAAIPCLEARCGRGGPEIRSLVADEERRGKRVFRLSTVEDLDGFLSRSDS